MTTTTTTPITTTTQDQQTNEGASHVFDDLPSFLCCCSILDDTLGPNEHLADCELKLFKGEFSVPLSVDSPVDTHSDGTGSAGTPRDSPKKRKHRESMARLRKKLRDSIGTLQLQERQLARTLQRTVANFKPPTQPTEAKLKLQLAYYELVKEQLALQAERRNLNETWVQKDKYGRLVQRELDRMNAAAEEFDEVDTNVDEAD